MMKALLVLLSLLSLSLSVAAGDIEIARPGRGAIMVPGFRTYAANGYAPSYQNLDVLKELRNKIAPLKPITFTSIPGQANFLLCRASFPVYAPNKTSFPSFVEGALNMELAQAGLITEDAARGIQGRLDDIDFSSFGSGKWTLRATFSVEGKEPVTIKHEFAFSVSAGAVAGCTDVTNALTPAVEGLLLALYSDPRFIGLAQ